MLTLTTSRPRRAPNAFAAIAAVMVALVVSWALDIPARWWSSPPTSSASTAAVVIDGERYTFTPSTCVIVDGGFVVSGPGSWNGERFVASIAPGSGVELGFGVASDVERPDAHRSWWLSGPITNYRIDGRAVRGSVEVRDQSGNVEGIRTATVAARCPSS